MNVEVFSKFSIPKLIASGFPENTAVISFYSPVNGSEKNKFNYEGVCQDVFYVGVYDITSIESFAEYGYTNETFLAEADELAQFIYDVKQRGMNIICQCEFGSSRSAACAAAILEHFDKRGSVILSNDRYHPNQIIYKKILLALEKVEEQIS